MAGSGDSVTGLPEPGDRGPVVLDVWHSVVARAHPQDHDQRRRRYNN